MKKVLCAIMVLSILILSGCDSLMTEGEYLKLARDVDEAGKDTCNQKGLNYEYSEVRDFDTYYLICSSSSPNKIYPFEMNI